MDIFIPKRNRKFILVYKNNMRVLDDYIQTLMLFDEVYEIQDFNYLNFLKSDDIVVFTQMWLSLEHSEELLNSPRFIFLNVENLTEKTRHTHITKMIDKGIRVADYSIVNIKIMNDYIKKLCPEYKHTIIHLPYQYHPSDFCILYNTDHEYEYDVGMIGAYNPISDTVDNNILYKRNKIWEEVQKNDWKSINIVGWKKDRDELIKKCKLIVNIHLFDVYNIFQHIRCDRLIFANKLILSEISLDIDKLDIQESVYWQNYDKIIPTIQHILDNFDEIQKKLELIPKEKIIKTRQRILQENVDLMVSDVFK